MPFNTVEVNTPCGTKLFFAGAGAIKVAEDLVPDCFEIIHDELPDDLEGDFFHLDSTRSTLLTFVPSQMKTPPPIEMQIAKLQDTLNRFNEAGINCIALPRTPRDNDLELIIEKDIVWQPVTPSKRFATSCKAMVIGVPLAGKNPEVEFGIATYEASSAGPDDVFYPTWVITDKQFFGPPSPKWAACLAICQDSDYERMKSRANQLCKSDFLARFVRKALTAAAKIRQNA